MSKDLNLSILLDFYSDMITDKQREALDYYYNDDLSLLEISEHMNISRQGVRDFIKKGEKQLTDLENKLCLAKKFGTLNEQINQISGTVDRIKEMSISSEVMKELVCLENILKEIRENL